MAYNPFQALGVTVSNTGRLLGLPEMNISEKLGITGPRSASNTLVAPAINGLQGIPLSQWQPSVSSYTTPSSSGGSTYQAPTFQQPSQQQPSNPGGPSAEDIYRQQMESQINSGYDQYFNSLDQMLNGLSGQRTAQEGIANTSYNANVTDLGLQRDQNQADLNAQGVKTEQNQVKTLKDISANIRNLMTAGNTYLGAQGAGDSSAVNQYAYGLTKLGSQQRGDVQSQTAGILSDIADRGSKLNNVFMQEKNRLASERDTAIQGIASWFADAQNQLSQAKANGQLSKSQDLQSLTTNLYNQAVNALTQIQQQTAQRQATLESWAANNATNLAQLKQNMAGIGAYIAPQQQAGQIQGSMAFAPQGTRSIYGGGGQSYDDIIKRLSGLA